MKPSDIVRVYDTVNKIKNFPGYQPKSCQETLMDIVISSVGLMGYLKFRKKLSEADVEEAEDLIKDIHMENTRQKLIKEGVVMVLIELQLKVQIRFLPRSRVKV